MEGMFLAIRSEGEDGVPRTEGKTHPDRAFLGDRACQLSFIKLSFLFARSQQQPSNIDPDRIYVRIRNNNLPGITSQCSLTPNPHLDGRHRRDGGAENTPCRIRYNGGVGL
jgi:hypothetical protein